jgi:hypothetical protein
LTVGYNSLVTGNGTPGKNEVLEKRKLWKSFNSTLAERTIQRGNDEREGRRKGEREEGDGGGDRREEG